MIIAVANQKGGVGKTTTAINLSASLAHLSKQVLLVDIDPQGNSTNGMGVDKPQTTVYESLVKGVPLPIVSTRFSVDVVPADQRLVNANMELAAKVSRETRLTKSLLAARHYDFVIIDCNPSLDLLTINALAAADAVLIPVEPGQFGVIGFDQLHNAIREVWEINKGLRVLGYLITRADNREKATADFKARMRAGLGDAVFQTVIRLNSKIKRSQENQMPVLFYDPRATGTTEYMELAKEVIARAGN